MKEKILYIYPEPSTFIQKDINFLSEKYEVIVPGHTWKSKFATPLNFLKQLVFFTSHLRRSKAVFIMFGGYWSFLPALLGRITGTPVYIIPGGTDCVSFPSLRYGSLRKPVMRTFIRWSFRLCTGLLPVDGSLVKSDYGYHYGSGHSMQGYKHFFPEISTPFRVINNGFDPDFFVSDPEAKINNTFIIVASVTSMMRIRVKGIDLLVFLAREFSHCSFRVIGISDDIIQQLGPIPPNVTMHPFMPKEKFRSFLAESQFVLQLSVSEGFPNALCEAMLCHCIPVGSAVGGIPGIIGDTGFVVSSPDKDYLRRRFEEILGTDSEKRRELGLKARHQIAENFHISKRKEAFFEVLENGLGEA
ncbi:MAG: glycosyltransferase family 4 protein [Bacteroidales bacterium]